MYTTLVQSRRFTNQSYIICLNRYKEVLQGSANFIQDHQLTSGIIISLGFPSPRDTESIHAERYK